MTRMRTRIIGTLAIIATAMPLYILGGCTTETKNTVLDGVETGTQAIATGLLTAIFDNLKDEVDG